MKVKTITFMLLAALLTLSITSVYAQKGGPPLPHAFYGAVTINGSPAPIGTRVEARGEGVAPGQDQNPMITTAVGAYGGPGGFDPKLIVQCWIADGTTLRFYVNGLPTAQTAQWRSGEVTELNLSVTIE